MQQQLDKRGILKARDGYEALRGPDGRLYGYIDAKRMIIEVKRKGEPAVEIDLRRYLDRLHSS